MGENRHFVNPDVQEGDFNFATIHDQNNECSLVSSDISLYVSNLIPPTLSVMRFSPSMAGYKS